MEFNEDMMSTMCIFRRSTIDNIKILLKDGNLYKTLFTAISEHDRVFWKFWHDNITDTFMEEFHQKLLGQMSKVLLWVSQCQLQMQP